MKEKIMFLVSVGGIYASYLTMSVFSQQLYLKKYASDVHSGQSDRFQYPELLVWLGSLFCALFGLIRSIATKEKINPIPLKEQGILGILYTINILLTNMALLYLPYPVQVIGRQTRLLAVVLVGVFFTRVKKSGGNGKTIKLNATKLIAGIVITLGVLIFNFAKNTNKQEQFDQNYIYLGYTLLIISILADATFADSQAYCKANFDPTANHLFTSANKMTFFFCFVYSILKGDLMKQIIFCMEHNQAMIDLLMICTLQVFGQVSIYYVVANYKQHIFPIISTTRKIFTFLLSVFIYHHSLNEYQWAAILIVFGGVIYEYFEEKNSKLNGHKTPDADKTPDENKRSKR